MSKLDAVTGGIWTISVIETRLSSSIYLKSSQVNSDDIILEFIP